MQYDELNERYGTVSAEILSVISEAVGQALQGEVKITGDTPKAGTPEFSPAQTFPLLRVSMGSTAGARFEHQFIMEKSVAGIIFGWMVGGEPPEEIGDEHLDAVKEMVAQVLGQLQAALDGEEHAFTAGDVEVAEIATLDEFSLPEDSLVASYQVARGEEEQTYLITHILTGEALPETDIEGNEEGEATETEGEEVAESAEEGGEPTAGEDLAGDLAADFLGGDEEMSDLFGGETTEDIVEASPVEFEEFDESRTANGKGRKIDMLLDVELDVTVELGRKVMYVEDILRLGKGSVIELNKLAGEPVDILVNGKKLAEGEVVVVEDHFGIRLTHLVNPKDRIRSLGRA